METLMQFMVIKKNGTTNLIAEIATTSIFLQEISFFIALVVQNVYTNLWINSTVSESQKKDQRYQCRF